jgi:hypothetical protein
MLLGLASAILMAGAGYAGLRLLRITPGPYELGLVAPTGVAVLAVLSIWGNQIRMPEVAEGVVILGVCLTGLSLAIRDLGLSGEFRRAISQGVMLTLLLSALVVPLLVLGPAVFVQAGVPDYVHDGATHAEIIDALRHGVRLPGFDWYPTRFHAPAAALLGCFQQLTRLVERSVGP